MPYLTQGATRLLTILAAGGWIEIPDAIHATVHDRTGAIIRWERQQAAVISTRRARQIREDRPGIYVINGSIGRDALAKEQARHARKAGTA